MNKLLKPFLVIGNAFVRWILRTRAHRLLSRSVVLLEIKGRRSGRTYLVPVSYKPADYGITIMTYRRRMWWRNLLGSDEIPIYLRGSRILATPEVVSEDREAIGNGLLERGWVRKSAIRAKAAESVLIRLRIDMR